MAVHRFFGLDVPQPLGAHGRGIVKAAQLC